MQIIYYKMKKVFLIQLNIKNLFSKMNKYLSIILLFISFVGCRSKKIEADETFYDSGEKKSVKSYYYDWKNRKLPQGDWIDWYKNGQISSKFTFRKGKPEGVVLEWHANGEKKLEGIYLDGLQSGKWTSWFQSGQTQSVQFFLKGLPVKSFEKWHANGKKELNGQFNENNDKYGRWIYWNDKGELVKEKDYKS